MTRQLTRILSDVHYGDRSSHVRALGQLEPLTDGVDALVFNGDTLDTRSGPNPQHTADCRADVESFARAAGAPVTFLTGNHDPDLTDNHWSELAGGEVFVIHGDVLFEDIVPWGRDAALIRSRIAEATGLAAASGLERLTLAERMSLWRSVARSVPQRHQSEQNPLKYLWRFAADTIWPPTRFLEIFRAWRREPELATALIRRERPDARYILLGHTHRPAIRQVAAGPVIINTGSFTAPFGGYAVDVTPDRLRVRRTLYRRGAFHPGPVVAEFPLAGG